jgi:hypothetical protein
VCTAPYPAATTAIPAAAAASLRHTRRRVVPGAMLRNEA